MPCFSDRKCLIFSCIAPSAALIAFLVAGPVLSSQADAPAVERLGAEQQAFWRKLERFCGQAFAGRVSDVTAYYREALTDRQLLAHGVYCSAERIHIALHVDDNRSRNWILTVADDNIRLKHDHRYPDGQEEAISQYGGDALVPGLAERQIFPADAHTAALLPERADNFWFMHFVDDSSFHYGVHWPKHGHSVRLAFDLSEPVSLPPLPWGYED
ncbi:MAG: hypothetical protein EA418_13345 [Wenzhouxiangellaceae bacterium]|nr:MAG: hypothetical protein EA418_13345 [Wenzhouxiangellaceae bacterium]